MEAYRTGVTVLRSLRKEQGLQVGKVEDVMDDLKEVRSSKPEPDVVQDILPIDVDVRAKKTPAFAPQHGWGPAEHVH